MGENNKSDDAPKSTAKDTHPARVISSHAVTINCATDEVYGFFRDLTKAPLYMSDVERVEVIGSRSHWIGKHGEWDSEITEDIVGQEITWQAEESAGRATFDEVPGRGTVLTLTMAYEQSFIAKLVGKMLQTDPAIQSRRNLRRLKQLLETGEIATSARNQRMLTGENR